MQPIAHELAHFGWNFGAGQGDWINQALAEYFSSLAIQRISSQQEFNRVRADYRKQVGDLPPDAPSLAEVPFLNDQNGFVVRYYKGALMLDSLRKLMGDEFFFDACREEERPALASVARSGKASCLTTSRSEGGRGYATRV